MRMIGRKKQLGVLFDAYCSKKNELLIVYGRKKIGKTYLVEKAFRDRIVFKYDGNNDLKGTSKFKKQLQNFSNNLETYGLKPNHALKSWKEAFDMIKKVLKPKLTRKRMILFFDNFQLIDTPRSNFLKDFNDFWNNYVLKHKNIMIIISGNLTANDLDKLSGIYTSTRKVFVDDLTIKECEDYFVSNNISITRRQILDFYLKFGGVPAYFTETKYDLFSSYVNNIEMQKIIDALKTKGIGLTKNEIVNLTGISDGGYLTDIIRTLIVNGYIIKYIPLGESKRIEYYKLFDNYCLDDNEPKLVNLVLKNMDQIRKKLNIYGVKSVVDSINGGKIILIRADKIVNLFDVKWNNFEIISDEKMTNINTKKYKIHKVLINLTSKKISKKDSKYDEILNVKDMFN